MKAFAVAIDELVLAILDHGALDLLGGLVALRSLHAVADAAHVDLGGRGALARMEAFGGQDDVELVVDLEDVALADRAGDNLHRCYSFWLFRPDARDFGPNHTDPGRRRQPFRMTRPVTDPSPWWDRDGYADRRPFLLARGRILSALRDWFRSAVFSRSTPRRSRCRPGTKSTCTPSRPN